MKDDVSQKERRLLNLLLLLGKTKASAFGWYYTGYDGHVDWALTHMLDGGGGGGRECLPSGIHTINQVESWHSLSNCCGVCGNVTVLCVAQQQHISQPQQVLCLQMMSSTNTQLQNWQEPTEKYLACFA